MRAIVCLSETVGAPAQAIPHELHHDAGFRERNHKFFGGGNPTDRTAIGPVADGIAPCVTRPI